MKRHVSERRNTRGLIHRGVFVVAVCTFLFAIYQLYTIAVEYNQAENEYKELRQIVVEQTNPSSTNSEDSEEKTPLLNIDFLKLAQINADIVAWIYFEEPKIINYPIVKSRNNVEYLAQTFEKKENSSGALFIDMNNAADFSDKNTFIHGHNMKNGSMFGRLRKYKNEEFCKEHPYFYIYTPDGKEHQYEIFSVTIVTDTSDSYALAFYSDEEYGQYIKNITERSRYKTNVEVTAASQIVSLSTCTNVEETQRLLIHAVKIGEKQVQ